MAKRVRNKPTVAGRPLSLKNGLISELAAARQDLIDQLGALSSRQQEQVFLGEWSPKHLLSHLLGWDQTYLAALDDLRSGQLPAFYEAYDDDWRSYNRQLVRRFERMNWLELMAAAKESHSQLVDYLKQAPEDEFDHDFGVQFRWTRVTIKRLLEAEIEDEREHLSQVRRWEKT